MYMFKNRVDFKNVLLYYLASTEKMYFAQRKKKDKKGATFPFFFKENCNIYE